MAESAPSLRDWLEKIVNSFLLRRLAKALFTIWLVSTITFFVVRAMPGNAVEILIQDLTSAGVSPEDAKAQAASMMGIDLNQPVSAQYLEYIGNVARGDLGNSYKSRGLTVSSIIAQVLPWTIFSVGLSLLITFVLGIALGAIMAYKRDTWIDHLLSNVAATLDAISPYLIGLLAILIFGVLWKIDGKPAVPIPDMRGALSPGMQPEFSLAFFLDVFKHVRVLLLVYVLSSIGSWMLQMKSNTISTLGEDYVTVARARGLSDGRILTAYVGRNATLPLFTRLAISVGFVVGGSVLVETLFTYRGVGFQLAKALSERDYPVMQGVFLIITIAVVFANLLADYVYGWLDPRVRIAGGGGAEMHAITESLAGIGREGLKTLKILSRNKMGLFGFVMAMLIVLISFVGPMIWPPEDSANVADINKGISATHWLGADFQGQDNLRKIVNGGKDIVTIAFLTGILSMLIAVVVGSFSAFIGGRVDSLLMELVNVWLTIPKFPLLAVLATVLRLNDVVTLSILMAFLDWPGLARQVRSQVLSLKRRDYVEAATMLDLGTPNIIFRELLPNMMSFIAISTIFEMTHAIYQQTGLVFLGIVPYSSANWGVMISAAERRGVLYNPQAVWSILAPMGAIVLFQLALVSFARSLDEVFNPRLRTSV